MASYQRIVELVKIVAQYCTVIEQPRIKYLFDEWFHYMKNVKGVKEKELFNVALMAYHHENPVKYLTENELFQVPIYTLDIWEIIKKSCLGHLPL